MIENEVLNDAVPSNAAPNDAPPKRKLDLELQNAYYQLNPGCYYCGGCLVDGPTPDFEIVYLFVLC